MQVPVGHEEGVLVGDVGREGRRQSVNVAFDGDQFVAEASSGGQSEEGRSHEEDGEFHDGWCGFLGMLRNTVRGSESLVVEKSGR